jgi:hypothetical protein
MPSQEEKQKEDPFQNHVAEQSHQAHSPSSAPYPALRAQDPEQRPAATPEQMQALGTLFGESYGAHPGSATMGNPGTPERSHPGEDVASQRATAVGTGTSATSQANPVPGTATQKPTTPASAPGHAPQAPAHPPLKLQTGEDSRVVVSSKDKGTYQVQYEIGQGKDATRINVAKLTPAAQDNAPLNQLPFYIEDVCAGGRAVIHIKYDPSRVTLEDIHEVTLDNGGIVQVVASKCTPEEMMTKKPPAARRHNDIDDKGYVLETDEKIIQHSSTPEDRVASSIASAEGGFATVEASDKGILTWGQGQWIASGGAELQNVLAFIKSRHPDLFDRYWGSAGLDVQGAKPTFHYQGKPYQSNRKEMLALFRPTGAQNLFWTNLFAQAGIDPQIQRLQREYQRHEVREFLESSQYLADDKDSLKPSQWLNERAQAFFYSAYKNYPQTAIEYLHKAVHSVAGAHADPSAAETARERISQEFERLYKESTTKSFVGVGEDEHIQGIWGEGARRQGIELAKQRIQEAEQQKTQAQEHGDVTAAEAADKKKTRWKDHLKDVSVRESRYHKSAGDIAAASRHHELDVPASTQHYFGADINLPTTTRRPIEDEAPPPKPASEQEHPPERV